MSDERIGQSKVRKGSVRDLLYVLFGHKKKMLAFMILLFGVVALRTMLAPHVYRSEAKLLLRVGRENVSLDPTATVGEVVSINRSYDWEVNSEIEILKSREVAERVVDELGASFFLHGPEAAAPSSDEATAVATPTDDALATVKETLDVVTGSPGKLANSLGLSEPVNEREKAIRRLTDNIEIKAQQNTSVIDLSYNERDPEAAKVTLEKYIQAFLEKHLSVYCSANSHQFFERQVSQLQEKLTEAENELQNIKDTTGISDLKEQRTVTVTAIGALEKNISEAEAELVAATAKVAGIQQIMEKIPETVVIEEISGFSDYGADLMRSKLYDLRVAEKDLEGKYRPDSRQFDMMRKQVEEATSMLEKEQSRPERTELRKGLNNAYQQMQLALFTEQSSIASLQSKIDKMRAQLGETRATLKTLNQVENQTTHLEREINMLEASYNQYFTKLEEARIDQALKGEKISNVNILQAATLPAMPMGPGKVLRLGLGLLLAIVGGVAFAFFCEYLDHSIKTPEDVHEKLQLPTLASIPQARANTVGPVWKSTLWKRFGIKPRQTAPVQWDLPAHMRRHYAVFREQLLLSANGSMHGHYVLGVTSSSRCEGVSTVASNLASSLSEQGRGTVLLVDANIHDPSIHRIFRTRLSPGLVDVLGAGSKHDEDDAIVRRAANLNVLTAGSTNGSAAKGIASESFVRFLDSIKQNYRVIVVDIPALDEDGSTARLASSCDGVVLVVETERLRWETISQAKQRLQQLDVNMLGVLLNKRRFPVPNWIYAAL